jgi:hypothetical protein
MQITFPSFEMGRVAVIGDRDTLKTLRYGVGVGA